MTDNDRTAYVNGLYNLTRLLDIRTDLPLPYSIGRDSKVSWYVHTIGDALALRDVMDDPTIGRTDSITFPVAITGTIGGLSARVEIHTGAALAPGETITPTLPALNPLLVDAAVTA